VVLVNGGGREGERNSFTQTSWEIGIISNFAPVGEKEAICLQDLRI